MDQTRVGAKRRRKTVQCQVVLVKPKTNDK